jgi:hypothetical protein
MSISAMKQAVKALEFAAGLISPITKGCQCQICLAHTALRQAIKEAKKQEPVAVKHMMDWVYQLKRFSNDGRYMSIPSGLSAGACYELAVEIEQFIKTAPVHASDISQECADETAKCVHEPLEQCSYPKCQATNGCVGVCSKGQAEKQEPYGYFRYDIQLDAWVQDRESTQGVAFYTAPPKREWVGLTDEERKAFSYFVNWEMLDQIEAKLKEKNSE